MRLRPSPQALHRRFTVWRERRRAPSRTCAKEPLLSWHRASAHQLRKESYCAATKKQLAELKGLYYLLSQGAGRKTGRAVMRSSRRLENDLIWVLGLRRG